MRTEQEIKTELAELLKAEKPDYSAILALSNELAQLDSEHVRFSVDAGLINRLGTELVSRQETAVSELVKNAYDADANTVDLKFINTESIGGTLVITDTGNGMTREQLIDGFMRISSSDKIENPLSPIYHRKRAGKKGIGRFAVQRLGTKLIIHTKSIESSCAYEVVINWDEYESNTNLLEISHTIREVQPEFEKGTRLMIMNLRDKWSEASIRRIYRYVIEIMQPTSLSSEITLTTEDPGFSAKFFIEENGVQTPLIDSSKDIAKYAVGEFSGEINSSHIGSYRVKSERLGIDFSAQIGRDPDDINSPFSAIKNIKYKAYYFIYDTSLIPKQHLNAIRKLANLSAGIRLYRNGFRVLPYGEPGDDWLSFDMSSRRRSILPTHTNLSFFGFVEISDESGDFEETSSREGLLNNIAMIQLQNFMYRAILNSVIKIAENRNIKIVSGQKKDEKGNWEKIEIRVKNIAHTLDELDKALEEQEPSLVARRKRKEQLKKVKRELDEVAELQKAETKRLFKEQSMLRVLSSVGLTISQFVHEVKYNLDNIQDDIRFLVNELQNQYLLLNRVIILDENFANFATYTSYFYDVISLNVIRDLRPLELREVVKPFITTMRHDAAKSGIELCEPVFNGFNLYTIPMHPSEWSSILFNLYTNSKKAIKRTNNSGKILIECGMTEKLVYLEFSDNGDGIPKENEDKIFMEFFTTTSAKTLESINTTNEITGTGLGLKIVKDIVSSYKGNIMVVSPKGEFATCLRIEIPKAKDNDIY